MNDIRYILIALVATNLFVAISSAEHKLDKKLVKNFAKINDYLEKNVASDDLEDNIDKVSQWKEPKLSMFSDRSLNEAQEIFLSLPDTITTCDNQAHRELLSRCDEGLSDEAHLKSKDYPLGRIDRILEQVGYKHVRHCLLEGRPRMKFAFKQLAYDQINMDLFDKVANYKPEVNMKAAEEILGALENKNGSYGQALRQLLSLRTLTLDENPCTERGTEIVLKNDLATRGHARALFTTSYRNRIIESVVRHYFLKHSKICCPVYERNCLAHLHQLDVGTYRRILALAAAPHLKNQPFSEMEEYDNLMAEVNGKQVDQDFIVSSIANYSLMKGPSSLTDDNIVKFLKASTKGDPRSQFLEKVVDQETGERVLNREKVAELYNDFIQTPCEKLNSLVGPEIELFNYNWKLIQPSELSLNFRLLRSAVDSCEDILSFKDYYLSMLIEKLNPTDPYPLMGAKPAGGPSGN